MTTMAAADLGAQSGRVVVGRFDGERLSLTEVHRFPNVAVDVSGRLHWDALRLYDGILAGLRAAAHQADEDIASVAVDAWGLDFALLDRAGGLVSNPIHHRDRRTEHALDQVFERIPARELYERTGIQMMAGNSLMQLTAMVAAQDPALDAGRSLLMIPDLFHYWLCGAQATEFTAATTTQCYDPRAGDWAWSVLDRVGVPAHLFGEVVAPSTVLGPIRAAVAEETGLGGAAVIAAAGHDTAAAVAAIPFRAPGSSYISSGTWSLVGVEVPEPIIDENSFAANLTNEGGVGGTVRLLRNVTGMWLLHECRRAWALVGSEWTFAELVSQAETAPPLAAFVDPDDLSFVAPGDMPQRVRDACSRTGQLVPHTAATVVRCILESLALKYRWVIEHIAAAARAAPAEIHIVGGGAQNALLCQLTADATGLPVLAGPVEATAFGNLIAQAIGLGELASLGEGRELIRRSVRPEVYEPRHDEAWDEAYDRFKSLTAPAAATVCPA